MIVFIRRGVRVGEVYYTEDVPDLARVDLIRHIGVLSPRDESKWFQAHTILIELAKGADLLLKEMESGTRYEIRRAEGQDALNCLLLEAPSRQEVDAFCDYYDDFARTKSLRPVFRSRTYELAREGMLLLGLAADAEGRVLSQHAHVVTSGRAGLLYSASKFRESQDSAHRALVGRANRYLHWREMLRFKERGIPLYDLTGIDVTGKSPETTRIAQFKRGFGGRIVPTFTRSVPQSAKGHLVKWVLRALSSEF